MAVHHLSAIGAFAAPPENVQEQENFIDRRALLVYAGDFESKEGPVRVTDDQVKHLIENHNSTLAKIKRLAAFTPLRHYPPVQLDHSDSARDTVGRLVGDLEQGEYEYEDGRKVPAVYGTLRILGKDNVERVKDGRWTHLSLGADFERGHVSELSVTPFPAAADASLLTTKRDLPIPGHEGLEPTHLAEGSACKACMDKWMHHEKEKGTPHDKAVAIAISECKDKCKTQPLEHAMHDHEKLKGYLTGHKKMSEKEADEHLSRLSKPEHSEELKKLSMDFDDWAKEEKKEHEKKMSAARDGITKLTAGFKDSAGKARLQAATGKVITRLSRLRASGKVTPAEIKKMDIAKLAASPDKEIELVLGTYEAREPVIMAGQYGTVKGTDISQLTAKQKQQKMTELEAQTRQNMSLLRGKGAETKLHGGAGGEHTEDEATPPAVTTEHEHGHHDAMKHMEHEHEEIHKMYAAGLHHEAKERLKAYMAKHLASYSSHMEMSDVSNEETEKHLSALAQSVEQMQAQFEEITKLAATIVA